MGGGKEHLYPCERMWLEADENQVLPKVSKILFLGRLSIISRLTVSDSRPPTMQSTHLITHQSHDLTRIYVSAYLKR